MLKRAALNIILGRTLLLWYSQHKRDLPWRHTRDPYKIWISEIMLQQTQVATVIPYYTRWLKTLPDLAALAAAPSSKVLGLWAGLGYYRRARMLHKAAQHIQKNLGGKIPHNAAELRKLPGIGRYTAGAIASIAFDERTPVLDGNVIRILTRIFAVPQSVDRPSTQEKLWAFAAALLPDKKPGDLNQSLMELGATVCSPTNPHCPRCPVKKLCAAHRKGTELSYPVRSRKDSYEKLKMAALVMRNDRGKVWLEKQKERERWGGLWMFPFWKDGKAMFAAAKALKVRPLPFLTVRHAFTKYRITLAVYQGRCEDKTRGKRRQGKWCAVSELAGMALPSPHKKIVQALEARTRH